MHHCFLLPKRRAAIYNTPDSYTHTSHVSVSLLPISIPCIQRLWLCAYVFLLHFLFQVASMMRRKTQDWIQSYIQLSVFSATLAIERNIIFLFYFDFIIVDVFPLLFGTTKKNRKNIRNSEHLIQRTDIKSAK